MSFWKFEFKPTSAIDTLLDQEDVQLTQILNEEDVIQECKVQNRKLIDFLVQQQVLEELVGLVAQEPPDTKDERLRFKFSHVACEILTSEVCDILNGLCNDENHLIKLWDFLERKPPLNPLIGSFLSRVLSVLLNHKCPVILKFIQEKENFLELFLQHLNTSAICDLLLQMIAAPDTDQTRLDLAMWLSDNGIVRMLVDLIKVGVDEELCVNVAQLLGDVVRIGRESFQMATPSPIVGKLEDQESINQLLINMFDVEDGSDLVMVSGISFLLSLIEPRRNPNPFDIHQTPVEDDTACLQSALSALVSRLDAFKEILTREPKLDPQETTVGRLEQPFGNTRLQVLKLFTLMLSVDSDEVILKFVDCQLFDVLLDLFVQYPWNNFLHLQVEQCVNAVLDMEGQENQEGSTDVLQKHLFKDCALLKRLLNAHNINEQSVSSGSRRQGYMGHLIRMVNSIKKWYESRPALKELIQSVTEDDMWSQWCDYITGPIAESNRRNEMMLGGQRTLTSSFDDSEEDFDPHNLGPGHVLEKEYSDYRNAAFVVHFEDDYGSDILDTQEEPMKALFEKPTTVVLTTPADELQSDYVIGFESVCSARIRQFDESESEVDEERGLSGDPWSDKDILMNSTFDRNSSALFSSSDDDDNEPFDPHMKKLSSEDYFDPMRTTRQLEGQQNEPPQYGDRSQDYLVGSLGADSRTHTDLSRAGLEDGVFRDRIISGDSDDEESDDSDIDTRGVVGLTTNLDWAKEVEPMEGEGWADFDANEERVRAEEERSEEKPTSEDSSTRESGDVDLTSAEAKQLLDDSSEEPRKEEGKVDQELEVQEVVPGEGDMTRDVPDVEELSEGIEHLSLSESVDTTPVEEPPTASEIPPTSSDEPPVSDNTPTTSEDPPTSEVPPPNENLPPSDVPPATDSSPTQQETPSEEPQEAQKQEVPEQNISQPNTDVHKIEKMITKDLKETSVDSGKSHDCHVTLVDSPQTLTAPNDVTDDVNDQGTPVDGDVPLVSHLPNGPSSNNINFENLELNFGADFGGDFDDEELHDNFSFLQKGLISKSSSDSIENQEQLRRIKQEAQEACRQYEQETQAK